MFNKAKKVDKKSYRKNKHSMLLFTPPDAFYREYEKVCYAIKPSTIRYDNGWDYFYREDGSYFVWNYKLKSGNDGKLDFSFCEPNYFIRSDVFEDVNSITIRTSNIRYAKFIGIENESNDNIHVDFNIVVDTDIVDAVRSLRIFIRNHRKIINSIKITNAKNNIILKLLEKVCDDENVVCIKENDDVKKLIK